MDTKTYNSRSFDKFIGETIVKVDTSCINVVHFHTQSGKVISVHPEEQYYDTLVVSVNEWEI